MSTTRSLILRAEHKLHLFENKVLRKIYGPTKNEVRNFREPLHNEANPQFIYTAYKVLLILCDGLGTVVG